MTEISSPSNTLAAARYKAVAAGRRPGARRKFDAEAALDAVLDVFWRKGFEGASMTDLTTAAGVSRPSLYKAFGNKASLFNKALELHGREQLAATHAALEAPTARGVAERLLRGALERQTKGQALKGDLTVTSCGAWGAKPRPVKAAVMAHRVAADEAVLERFRQAKADGDLPDDVEPEGLAIFLGTLLHGLLLRAGSGASQSELQKLVATALTLWPGR